MKNRCVGHVRDTTWFEGWFMKWMPVETVLLWSGVWEGVWDRWSSLKHSYHLPAQAPFSVRVSISGGTVLNASEPTVVQKQTLYFQ